jgi:hypothetical protein
LQRSNDDIKKKQPHLAKKKVLFHQDNAPVHTSVITMAKINDIKFELHPHAPRFSPLGLFSFSKHEKWFGGQRFANYEEMKSAVDGYFVELDGCHYKQGVEAIKHRREVY